MKKEKILRNFKIEIDKLIKEYDTKKNAKCWQCGKKFQTLYEPENSIYLETNDVMIEEKAKHFCHISCLIDFILEENYDKGFFYTAKWRING